MCIRVLIKLVLCNNIREDEIRGFRSRPVEKHVDLDLDGSQKDEQNRKEKEKREKRRRSNSKDKPKGPKSPYGP